MSKDKHSGHCDSSQSRFKSFYLPSPRLNPIKNSYRNPSFPSGPLPLRSELEGAVVEISPYQMEQPFKTLILHQ